MKHVLIVLVFLVAGTYVRGQSACSFVDNQCLQNADVVEALKSRALPEFSSFIPCLLQFSNETGCAEIGDCYFQPNVFNVGGSGIDQCFPNITSEDLPVQEASQCFQVTSIWRPLIPCQILETEYECVNTTCTGDNCDYQCQWYGGICGPVNDTLSQEQRQAMLESQQAIAAYTQSGNNTELRALLESGLVSSPSFFCKDVIVDWVMCGLENQDLINGECGDILNWFWEDATDRKLMSSLAICAEEERQNSQILCEELNKQTCEYAEEDCLIDGRVKEYLIGKATFDGRELLKSPITCFLYGNNQASCEGDGNCQFVDEANPADESVQGFCDGSGVDGSERIVQATIQIADSCFEEGSLGDTLASCIQYPYNLCPSGCLSQSDEFRCVPDKSDDPSFNSSIFDDEFALSQELLASLSTNLMSEGQTSQDYCENSVVPLLDCVTRLRDYMCGSQIIAAVFPAEEDQNLFRTAAACDLNDDNEELCADPLPSIIAELKAQSEPARPDDGNDAYSSNNVLSVLVMSVTVTVVTSLLFSL